MPIPSYPTNIQPTVYLNGVVYDLDEVDFIMWEVDDNVYSSEDEEVPPYESFTNATEWHIVMSDDTVEVVKVSRLAPDTYQHLVQVAYPD